MQDRLNELAREWRVTIDHSFETAGSFIAYGRRDAQPVVLKMVKCPGDEWGSGEALTAFDGRGVVRVYEHVGGALLLERLDPGEGLAELALRGCDEEATTILADVIGSMPQCRPVTACPTVQDWAEGFKLYLASGDDQVPMNLVSEAGRLYTDLCESQRNPRLLHGDLQHYNVLFDRHRGWLAIDPKGVVGEIEYEVGAALRNPCERPEVFADPEIIKRRLGQFASRLNLDPER
ncbi:MAG: aminoglycoside phosphotransferase family protein, partial [Actinomycetota bacterium]|nr:aminoglycoside phosphotransferase family protein [Actinomycetota bacterium]